MNKIEAWQCEICLQTYNNPTDARECEEKGMPEKKFKVGDIVFVYENYGWYDGKKNWIANMDMFKFKKSDRDGHPVRLKPDKCPNGNGNCFDECCCLKLYWVVTATTRYRSQATGNYEHRWGYHVATLAINNGSYRGYRCGIVLEGHRYPKHATNVPKSVRRESKKLLGEEFEYIL